MPKKWILKDPYSTKFVDKLPGYNPVVLQLLYDRGLDTQQKVNEFFSPDYTTGLHDPFLFQDMKVAVERILKAIQNKDKIFIHGDYDADGVTASVLMQNTLQKLGANDIQVFIPHRETDGYGLNLDTAQKIIDDKYNLVITLDCGVTNIQPIEKLKQAGVDTIVVDHHLEDDELPPALAILNCSLTREKYPFKKLAGVGMAFKLAQALFKFQTHFSGGDKTSTKVGKNSKNFEAFEKWLLDLVTIGTIGDISPILGENRTLVKYGLMVLNKTPRKGLRELIRIASLSNGHDPNQDKPLGDTLYDLSVSNISFQLVPRINATGRIAHAEIAYRLLTTNDETEAIALARDIQQKNSERQKITDTMLEQAKEIIGQVKKDQKILIAARQGWSPGVVGLVAGKLSDEFNLPVILLSKEGQKYLGSGRSIPEFNITQALHQSDQFIDKYGGHSQACGLTIMGDKNYEKFVAKINKIAVEKLKGVELIPHLEIDAEIKLKDLDWQLWEELEKFEPFAEANPEPLFLVKNVKVENIEKMGKNNDHLRFYLAQDNQSSKAISFGTAQEWGNQIKKDDIIDVVVEFGVNEWQGSRELQLKVVDFHSNSDTNKFEDHSNPVVEDSEGDDENILHKDLCFKINGVLYEVQNRLGKTSFEKQYCDLSELLLAKEKIKFEREKEIPFEFEEGDIKGNKVDFYVEDLIPLDFKAKKHITRDDYFQMQRYLNATKRKLGIIVNFKKYPLEVKRVINKNGIK